MFFIPRNYTDAGKILGLFETRHVVQALLLCLPLTFVVSIIPFLPLELRAVLWGILAGLPGLICLSGMLDKLIYMLIFGKTKRVYYSKEQEE